MFAALLPVWGGGAPVLARAAVLGVVYSLVAYVGVAHGKEVAAVRGAGCPLPMGAAGAAAIALVLDLGVII